MPAVWNRTVHLSCFAERKIISPVIMAGFSEEDIRKVREASDIVSVMSDRVLVRQKGRDFWCCCPIHEEKTPSCKIDPATQLWHCFGCGAGGDVFSLIMQLDSLSFPDAVYKLAERSNISITETGSNTGVAKGYKARLAEVCKETAAFYHVQLMRGKEASVAAARDYMAGRGFGGEVPKSWQLGFAPGNKALVSHLRKLGFKDSEMIDADVALVTKGQVADRFFNRIMFPIHDVHATPIAFGGRVLGSGEPKYLNSKETPIFHKSEVLYGLDKAKASMTSTGVAVVVEGYTDVIALHEAGITNVVATLGTALTKQHIRTLGRHAKNRVVYLFDGDAAGQRAAQRALAFIDDSITPEAGYTKIELMAVTLPGNADPADFVAEKGAEALQTLIDKAQSLIAYGIEQCLSRHDMKNAESRSRALNEALSILAPIKDSLLAKDYAVQIAARVRMRENDVLDRLANLERPRVYEAKEKQISPGQSQGIGKTGNVSPTTQAEQPLQAGQAQATQKKEATLKLPQPEVNRRRFEREFLSLCAQNPLLALNHADALGKTQWHESIHQTIAEKLLEALADNPAITAAEIVAFVSGAEPGASSILTSGVMTQTTNSSETAAFLVEELGIGDTEDAIESLKAQLADGKSIDPKDAEMIFESVVALQKDLMNRRQHHETRV